MVDPTGHMPEWLSITLKIVGGVAIISGCVVGSIFTGGTLSVVLAGATIEVTTGGISGAVAASPLGVGVQIGINSALGAVNYVGTQLFSGDNITLGELIFNAGVGAICGWIGQSGWMQGQITSAFSAFTGENALKHVAGMIGMKSLFKMTLPVFFFEV